jgi:hypothetical protein
VAEHGSSREPAEQPTLLAGRKYLICAWIMLPNANPEGTVGGRGDGARAAGGTAQAEVLVLPVVLKGGLRRL